MPEVAGRGHQVGQPALVEQVEPDRRVRGPAALPSYAVNRSGSGSRSRRRTPRRSRSSGDRCWSSVSSPPCRRGWSAGRRGRSAPSRRRGWRRRRAGRRCRGRRTPRSRATCGRRARGPSPRSRGCAGAFGGVRADVDRAPEADVDVGRGPARAGRSATSRVGPADQRAQPHRPHPDLVVEPVEELRQPLDRHLDVLDHPLAQRPPGAAVEPVGDPEAAVQPEQPHGRRRSAASAAARAGGPRGCWAPKAPEHQNQSVSQRHR